MSKTTRGKFDEKTTDYLQSMVEDLKAKGKHVRVNPSELSCWIIKYFKEKLYEKRKDHLYYSFANDNLYATELISKKMDLKNIEKKIKEFRQRKEEIQKKGILSNQEHDNSFKLKTSNYEESKVQFE